MKETLIGALKSAGRVLMKYYGQVQQVAIKESHCSIVTEADLAAEKNILNILRNEYPGHTIISEEMGFEGSGSDITWIIDPLDGTSNFAANLPWFAVIIAVLEKFEPILGGIYLPVTDELYFAEANQGATLNDRPIHVTKETNLQNCLVSYSMDYSGDRSRTMQEMLMMAQLLPHVRNLRSLNCVIEYCYTAEGRFGGCVNLYNRIWDIAAPWLILKEAGGTITDFRGQELNFKSNKSNFTRNFPIVGGSRKLHSNILNLIGDMAARTFKENLLEHEWRE